MRNVYHDKNNLYIEVGIYYGTLTFTRSKNPSGYELEIIIEGYFPPFETPVGVMLDEDFKENKWKEYKETFRLMTDDQRRKWTEDLVAKIDKEIWLLC